MKEFGSTLEVRGRKERTQSLSNVDILISPCDPDHRPPSTCPASPQSQMEVSVDKAAEKIRLEAAASFPLGRSKVTQYSSSPTLSSSPPSHRKSISSIIYSPAHQDQEGVTTVIPPGSQQTSRSPSMPHWGVHPSPKGSETKQEVEERTSSQPDGEQGGHTVDSHHGNGGGEELLVGEDKMYPTLRSKSLNANPRKTKRKGSEETPCSAGSVKDLVSAFGGVTGGLRSRTRSRDSD